MHGVAHVDEWGRGDKHDLQHPVADVGNREGAVVADVGATGLLGVAHEVALLVAPGRLCRRAQDQDAENEQDGEPNLPDRSGVLLDLFKEIPKKTPVSHLCSKSKDTPEMRK